MQPCQDAPNVDAHGSICAANAAAEELFGYGRRGLVDLPLAQLIPERARSVHAHYLERFFAKPARRPMAARIDLVARRADGSEIPVEIALNPVMLAGDLRAVAAIRDVSERQRRAREAALADERMRTLMDLARVGTWEVDLATDTRIYSPQLLGLLGIQDAHHDSAAFFDAVHPDDRALVFARTQRALLEGTPYRIELRVRRADGQWRWFETRAFLERDSEALPCKLRGLAMDITERKTVEETIRRSEENLRAIVDGSPDAIFISQDGVLVSGNQSAATLLGVTTPAQLEGLVLADVLRPDGPGICPEAPTADVGAGSASFAECHLARHGEATVALEANSVSIVRDGRAQRLTIARDVTEPRRAREQLRIADRVFSLGLMAASIAHDINNPLAVVIANLEFALRTGVHGAGLRDGLTDAYEAAARAPQIVRDLKVFSRAEDQRREHVDVRRVLDSSLRIARSEIRHRARVVRDYHEVPPVDANEARLGQVFLNLIVNAAQAIPEGDVEHHEVRVSTREEQGERVVVEISDTGAGIPREMLRELFTPFRTTKQASGGTGLGLAICRRILDEFGGEISCESEVAKGTVFRVTLQAAEPATKVGAPRHIATAEARRRGRVLIVDDEPLIGAAARRVLESEHEVVVMSSAAEAMSTIRGGERYDVILCDMSMPQATGMEFYDELAGRDPKQAARVIFMTGGASSPRARALLDMHSGQWIEKPFSVDVLCAAVNGRIAVSD